MPDLLASKKQAKLRRKVVVDQESKEELLWWSQEMSRWNGRAIIRKEVELIIESDASPLG